MYLCIDNERTTLIEADKVVSEDREVAETFKPYFETIVKNLGINNKFMFEEPVSNESVNDIITKFQNQTSIIMHSKSSKHNKNKEKPSGAFQFLAAEVEDVDREID